jgi:hypothetical protein
LNSRVRVGSFLRGLLEEYADDYNAREQDRHMQAADKALRDGLRRSSAPAQEEGPNWWTTGVEIVAGVLLEPIDWALTARDIYNDPTSPYSYAGLVPFIPAGAGKAAKALAGQADKLDEAIETVKAARAADQAEEAAKFAKPQAADAAKAVDALTGQIHHIISAKVHRALQDHKTLSDAYRRRDPRLVTQAADKAAHFGYQKWHRDLDAEVVRWLRDTVNENATVEDFEAWLRWRYSQPDLAARFPDGF